MWLVNLKIEGWWLNQARLSKDKKSDYLLDGGETWYLDLVEEEAWDEVPDMVWDVAWEAAGGLVFEVVLPPGRM
jgi:hypothetical protein